MQSLPFDLQVETTATKVLCTEDTLRERFAPFFAHAHKGSQRIVWPAANMTLRPSSGFTQGDVNSSKLFTCNTASLVQGLQDAAKTDATAVAIVDDGDPGSRGLG